LAGSPGLSGSVDGVGSAARFALPKGLTADGAGNIFLADGWTIRKIAPDATVTTIAGSDSQSGTNDGIGTAALFHLPADVAIDAANNIYVADTGNFTLRKITPRGTNWLVTTIAGIPRQGGSQDGTGNLALFGGDRNITGPQGIATDSLGNLYVADTLNNLIRKLTPS